MSNIQTVSAVEAGNVQSCHQSVSEPRGIIFAIFSVVPGDLPGILIGDLTHARNGPHNMVRCDLSGVETDDLADSPFRRDEKMPSATERYLAIQDHAKTESFIILGIKHATLQF